MKIFSSLNLWFHSALLALLMLALFSLSAMAKEPPSDACSLLTTQQLEKVLAQPFKTPDKRLAPASDPGLPSGTECNYKSKKGSAREVVFIAYVDPTVEQAKAIYQKLSMWPALASKPQAVGDSAYIDDNHAIHVLKGKVRYYINIVPANTVASETEKQLRLLAASVASQI